MGGEGQTLLAKWLQCLTDTNCRVATAEETIARLEDDISGRGAAAKTGKAELSDTECEAKEEEECEPAPPPLQRSAIPTDEQLLAAYQEEHGQEPDETHRPVYQLSVILQADAARCKHLPQKWGKSIALVQARPEGMVVPFVQLRAGHPFPIFGSVAPLLAVKSPL